MQQHKFDEVIVAARRGDDATVETARSRGVRVVIVEQPGVVAAMIAGAAATTSDIIAFTDDDARPLTNWSEQLVAAFERGGDLVGGVGGRDRIFDGEAARPTSLTADVGRVTWFGRVVGNHHCGQGPAREVAMLKGVNSAYRRGALRLPNDLRGSGAQAHFEIAVGRAARELGFTLLYDPQIVVEHYPADRLGDDQRTQPTADAVFDSAFNLLRGLGSSYATRRWLYVHLLGDRACPGIVRFVVAIVQRDRATMRRRGPSWRGTTAAWHLRKQPLDLVNPTAR
jgi:hypothetical protein